MADLQPGSLVDDFIVKRCLGKGGMGEVYLVHDPHLRVDRALKRIALTGPGFTGDAVETKAYRARFLREARTLARLEHPAIVPVHQVGDDGGSPFLVMTYFPGKTGRAWLKEARPNIERIRDVGVQLADALAYAHEHGVLHRDIKLTNFLVGHDDEAMMIDFGLAKAVTDEKLTTAGRTMGTFSYLAPEYVIAGKTRHAEHTVLTDLWAFGCALYTLTCRKPAFFDEEELKLLALIEKAQFTPVKVLRPDAPDAWAVLIHDLMQPDPALRIQTAREALERLENVVLTASKPAETPKKAAVPAAVVLPTEGPNADQARVVESMKRGAPDLNIEKTVEEGREPVVPAVPAVVAAPVSDESIFAHSEAELTPPTLPAPTALPLPSFELPKEPASNAKANAKKALLLPLAAAACVACMGAGLVVLADRAHATKRRAGEDGYVDPSEAERRERARHELEELDAEHKRQKPEREKASDRASPFLPLALAPAPATTVAPKDEVSQEPPPQAQRHAAARAPGANAPPFADDPWARRYGTRVSYNTSSSVAEPAAVVGATIVAPVAGTKIAVRVNDAIASAPQGPVIAVVEAPMKVGSLDLPAGTELHGRTGGTSGARILISFSFAIVNGKNVSLKGTALGADGRPGVPGVKNLGGVSDVLAGAAAGGAQALVGIAAVATGNPIAGGFVSGAGAPVVGKTSRLNNEEELVVANPGARFFVYVESLS